MEMAPAGRLRVGINMRNQLLVTGRTAGGEPEGLAPSMAAAFADRIGVPVEFIPYDSPAKLADDAALDKWDVAMIGADPARAAYVDFTAPYCQIEATYAVASDSKLTQCSDVDVEGIRIAGCSGAAYVLWLERNIKNAKLVKADGHDATYDIFKTEKLEALAGLRSKLTKDLVKLPGTRMLPGKFMAVEQAACTKKGRNKGFEELSKFIEEAKQSGMVLQLMQKFGVDTELVVAPAA
ncbi:unnamed protein product [Symbiodinium natans]|uniref:Solute-binding protein family 3/N-terminal domain-containing protein n=1 Tax=Symbiodinium natans TaxID=878477 RepID=A0A812HF25_9DINO|nr:unnamed protein product [Symbiodinium natans]